MWEKPERRECIARRSAGSRGLRPGILVLGGALCLYSLCPDAFTGYLEWKDAEPELQVDLETRVRFPIESTVHLSCPNAESYKISNHPDFPGARWRPFETSLDWRLDEDSDIATIFVVFRKRTTPGTPAYISPVISYSFDRTDLTRKIERHTDTGYVDWKSGMLHMRARATRPAGAGERYTTDKAQRDAENRLYEYGFDILKRIPVNHYYSIGDLLEMNQRLYRPMNEFLKHITIDEIRYISKETVEVEGSLSFVTPETSLAFLGDAIQSDEPAAVEKQYGTVFDELVMDVRGLGFRPCLFPEVITERGDTVLSFRRTTNTAVVYARYCRALDEDTQDESRTVLYVTALELAADNPSRIIVTPRYRDLILANPRTVDSICNGNFMILVE